MSSNNISQIGCVTSTNAKEAGFIPFSDLVGPVKSVEECVAKADEYGNLCAENDPNNKTARCNYVVYDDGDVYDLLRTADAEYQKSKNCTTNNEKQKYLTKSLEMFNNIWLSFTPEERKTQLSGNFMYGYADWIKKNNTYLSFFKNNLVSQRKPIQLKNKCWIGGSNVLESGYTHLVDFGKGIKNPKCKYGLYLVPGTEGSNYKERLQKYYQQQAEENAKQAKEAQVKAKTSKAMASFINNSKNMDVFSLFSAAKDTKSKIEMEAATEDTRESIKSTLKNIQEQEKYAKLLNTITPVAREAINKNIDLVKDKQQVANKMNADLQNLRWSLDESKNKELLQNKITTTLGIIIMLFAGLCVGLMMYYIIKGGPLGKIVSAVKNKTNTGYLNSIFGLNKPTTSIKTSKKAINSIFS